jgi:hypothetical protein
VTSPRQSYWRSRAYTALNRFVAADAGDGTAFGYGMAAGASGMLNGWTHPRTTSLLMLLLGTRNPDGGYGLGRPYDAFADGTVNPASTTYTVTLADHVGHTLLAAYKGGSAAVERQDVQDVANLLVSTQRVPVARGECVAYSRSPHDAAGQVHNVNAGVGWFLSDCNGSGFGATGMQKLITNITICEQVAYREDRFWWPYLDDGPDQDADHNSYTAESLYRLAYWVGREVAYRQMAFPPPAGTSNDQDPIVHTRLAGMPGGNGSWSRSTAGVTLWAELSDQWRPEQDEYLAGILDDRAAQFAYYAARASIASL